MQLEFSSARPKIQERGLLVCELGVYFCIANNEKLLFWLCLFFFSCNTTARIAHSNGIYKDWLYHIKFFNHINEEFIISINIFQEVFFLLIVI